MVGLWNLIKGVVLLLNHIAKAAYHVCSQPCRGFIGHFNARLQHKHREKITRHRCQPKSKRWMNRQRRWWWRWWCLVLWLQWHHVWMRCCCCCCCWLRRRLAVHSMTSKYAITFSLLSLLEVGNLQLQLRHETLWQVTVLEQRPWPA